MRRRTFIAAATATVVAPGLAETQAQTQAPSTEERPMSPAPTTGHVDVNGAHMYYESHGEGGTPLVLLHGAFSSIYNSFGTIIEGLAATRRVIGFDYQGHGRTADIDRPMSIEAIAADIVAALDELGIDKADVLGYSTGAAIALRIAIAHPEQVRKLIPMSATYRLDGIHPGLMEGLGEMDASMMYGSPWHSNYLELNPEPDFDRLFAKKTEMDKGIKDIPDEEISGLTQPVLLIAGDSDLPTIEHLAKFFRLLGGGIFGDTPAGLPRSQLAILPGASHVTAPFQSEVLLAIIPAFLDREEKPAT
ncbi:alpha/beta fold hydrolase [Devosia nitrariae]|uniref:Oxidoreductase n=1 Tax=Devosia nitrariae TaxID=2071872 RepID=A0ABQ5W203_9HYPH|nr:alpha/beta hydrolase [Devosia nitrariae]GLQ54095.1 oxidoreductase [Devosia nitrariae]